MDSVSRSSIVATALAVALLAAVRPVRADLETDTEQLVGAWRLFGQSSVSSPRILERGQLFPVLVAPSALDPLDPRCTTIAVLGASTTSFVIDAYPGGASVAPGTELPLSSLAGAAALTRCGSQKPLLARLGIEMRSPRAVIRVVVLRSERRPPSLVHVLPHRDPGPFAPLVSSGPRPALPPLGARVSAFEQNAKLAGAVETGRLEVVADADGTGSTVMRLDEGCHELALLSDTPPELNTPDLDAAVTAVASDEMLVKDDSDASDASMRLCVATSTTTRLEFAGAKARGKLALLHARYGLPSGIPERWEPRARAAMAQALWAHALTNVGTGPVYESLGVQGTTLLPVPVEPGACYTLGLALVQGHVSSLGMTSESGNHSDATESAPEDSGTALALCADTADLSVSVDVHSSGGATWMLAVWRTGRLRLGAEDH